MVLLSPQAGGCPLPWAPLGQAQPGEVGEASRGDDPGGGHSLEAVNTVAALGEDRKPISKVTLARWPAQPGLPLTPHRGHCSQLQGCRKGVDGGHWPDQASHGGREARRVRRKCGIWEHECKSANFVCGREGRALLLLAWALTPTSVPSIPSKWFDVNRTLLPLLSLSVLVCENGPAVPSQREALRTTRCFAGIWCSGQFGGFRLRVGHFPLTPPPPPSTWETPAVL